MSAKIVVKRNKGVSDLGFFKGHLVRFIVLVMIGAILMQIGSAFNVNSGLSFFAGEIYAFLMAVIIIKDVEKDEKDKVE